MSNEKKGEEMDFRKDQNREREKKGVKIQIRADENRKRDEGKNNEKEYKK